MNRGAWINLLGPISAVFWLGVTYLAISPAPLWVVLAAVVMATACSGLWCGFIIAEFREYRVLRKQAKAELAAWEEGWKAGTMYRGTWNDRG